MASGHARAGEVLPLLLVTSDDRHESSLRAILEGTSHAIHRVSNGVEALQLLDNLNPSVVLVEADLPAGAWKRLLDRVLNHPCSTELVVFSCFADNRLWAEVLNLGGYDVLAAPFEADEVLRTISSASRSHARKSAVGSSPPPGAPARSASAA